MGLNKLQVDKAVTRARLERLESLETIGSRNNPLAGTCKENAISLAQEILNFNVQPQIAFGAFPVDRKHPNSYEKAKKQGQQHYWVVVDSQSDFNWHLDVNSEYPPKSDLYAHQIIMPKCPSPYKLYYTRNYTDDLSF